MMKLHWVKNQSDKKQQQNPAAPRRVLPGRAGDGFSEVKRWLWRNGLSAVEDGASSTADNEFTTETSADILCHAITASPPEWPGQM
jgi:hypothetical protein